MSPRAVVMSVCYYYAGNAERCLKRKTPRNIFLRSVECCVSGSVIAPGGEGLLLDLGGQAHAVRHLGWLLLLFSLHHHPGVHGNPPAGTCGGRAGWVRAAAEAGDAMSEGVSECLVMLEHNDIITVSVLQTQSPERAQSSRFTVRKWPLYTEDTLVLVENQLKRTSH